MPQAMQLRATRKNSVAIHPLPPENFEFVLGRKTGDIIPEIDLSPDPTVSRQHARIGFANGKCWIEDLGSRMGTSVNGVRIESGKRVAVGPDDVLKVGNTELRLEREAPPDASAGSVAPAVQDTQTNGSEPEQFKFSTELLSETRASWSPPVSVALLQTIQDSTMALGRGDQANQVARMLMSRLLHLVPSSDHVALLLLNEDASDFVLAAHEPEGDPRVSTTLVRLAIEKKQAIVWVRARHGLPKGLATSIEEQHLENVLCAPLTWQGKSLGALWLGGLSPNVFTTADLSLVVAVAHQAAMAVAGYCTQLELEANTATLKRIMAHFSPKVAKHLLEQAKQGRLRPGGLESQVTILCSDLRGFTKTTARMSADDIVDMLNEYFAELVTIVLRHGGTVDKFIGDAILAVFGSPAPDPEQHANAVLAAKEMQAAMRRMNESRAARKQPAVELGIGIHCGKVLHGFIGSEERVEFTVIGDAVNKTSRYCDGAGPGEVVISPELHQVVWRKVKARRTEIHTKHEGDLPAFVLSE